MTMHPHKDNWREQLLSIDGKLEVQRQLRILRASEPDVPADEHHARAMKAVYDKERAEGGISDGADLYGNDPITR